MVRHEFRPVDVENLLVRSHRRCCVCHRYCGVKIEVDHIETAGSVGSDDIANAIPVCFECHAEVHHYNSGHPKGRRFAPSELRSHRDQWLQLCETHPEMFVHAQPPPEAGSLERLLNELEFNSVLAHAAQAAGAFEQTQFRRAIADGTFTWLAESIKAKVHAAYSSISLAHTAVGIFATRGQSESSAIAAINDAANQIDQAVATLREAL